ncbi:MAG TPA: erythromycin esterase family protein [Nocardioidaceae bacterium]|nr:erythromycin esterase family protein [Nocardioidaceae bacterium]
MLERVGDARFVLIGEASHGTHEFYTWRAAITRRLIAERGFGLVAVEGDWPDCYRVNCSVVGAPGAPDDPADALAGFDRWPTWMWANQEVAAFTRWLHDHNLGLAAEDRVGFYGLDVYSLWDSLRGILGYLREHEPHHVDAAARAFRCFEPYAEDPREYARATRLVPTSCEGPVVEMLADLRRLTLDHGEPERDARFNAEQNARVAAGAEAYYRSMVLVGFGSHHGSVVAGPGWGEPMQTMAVPPARPDSIEALLHDSLEAPDALFVFPSQLPGWLSERRDHRAIGVVYRPEVERWGNYVPTVLGRRYDAFCWFDDSRGLSPMPDVRPTGEERETWPFGR